MNQDQLHLVSDIITESGIKIHSVHKKSENITEVAFPHSADIIRIHTGSKKFFTRVVSSGVESPQMMELRAKIEASLMSK